MRTNATLPLPTLPTIQNKFETPLWASCRKSATEENKKRLKENMQSLTIKDLKDLSLNQVNNLFRQGAISAVLAEEYIELWNRGPHFTKAQLTDGVIRNYLTKRSR